jgi:hypothetical protein
MEQTYAALVARFAPLDLAYLHMVEGPGRDLTRRLRKDWPGVLALNPFTHPQPTGLDALALVEDSTADMIAFGALFLANPDLPRRLAAGGPFNTPDPATFYGGDHRGYTDYTALTSDHAYDRSIVIGDPAGSRVTSRGNRAGEQHVSRISERRLPMSRVSVLWLGLPVGCEWLDPITPQYLLARLADWARAEIRTGRSS